MLLATLALAASPPPPLPPPAPLSERALRVEPAHAMGDAVIWFAEEARLVQAAVAARLAEEGWDVIPLAEADAAMSRLDAGYIPDREGACSPLPPASTWLEQRYAGAAVASVDLRCNAEHSRWDPGPFEPGCVLTVVVSRGDPAEEVARWEVEAPLGASPAAVAARVPGLRRADPPQDGAGGLLGGLGASKARPIRVVSLDTTGPWGAGAPAGLDDALLPLHEALAACSAEPAPRFDFWGNPMQLDVDGRGRITRCERQYPDHHAGASQACECRVLRERFTFARGREGRRARFDLWVAPLEPPTQRRDAEYVSAGLAIRRSSDPSALVAGEQGGPVAFEAVNACLADGRLSSRSWPVTFSLGNDGRPTSTRVGPPRDGGPEPLRACLEAALAGARFTCPFTGAAEIDATLTLSRVPFGAQGLPKAAAARIAELGVALPDAAWVYEPALPSTPLYAVAADGTVSAVAEGSGDDEVRVAADGRASVDALRAALRARGPGLRRVFLVAGAGEPVTLRFLVNVPSDGATPVTVRVGTPPPARPYVSVDGAVFTAAKHATVADLVNAAQTTRERILSL